MKLTLTAIASLLHLTVAVWAARVPSALEWDTNQSYSCVFHPRSSQSSI